MVVLGDGYRATELNKYHIDVQTFVNSLYATAPFDQLWSAINIYRVDVVSTDSGADDPAACADGSAGSGAVAATYFDSTFCFGGSTRRLLAGNTVTALSVSQTEVPQGHVTLVLVNTPQYGGAGGPVAWFSTNPQSAEIGIHELGHTFFGLEDEYGDIINIYNGGEPAAPNITMDPNRATTKWRSLILPTTPLPTQSNPNCTTENNVPSPVQVGTIGLFEGSGRVHCGLYRAEYNCRMRTLGQPFCKICQQRIRTMLAPFGGAISWELTGNSGTNPATNFLGTTDNQPFAIRTNGSERLRITPAGLVGIRTTAPRSPLSLGGASATAGVETAEILHIFRPSVLGVKNTNSVGLRVGAFEPGITGRTRLDINLSGGPASSNEYGYIPDITVMSLLADGTVNIGPPPGPPTIPQPTGARLRIVSDLQDFYALVTVNTGGGGAIAGVAQGSPQPSITGFASGAGAGVHGHAVQTTTSSIGVIGTVGGSDPYLVEAQLLGGIGVLGHSGTGSGVGGASDGSGVIGNGVEGYLASGTGAGIYGTTSSASGVAVYGAGGTAGRFLGNVAVQGTLTASAKPFRIDHPLDPANKYLNHSSIESPDMMNVYNGSITTDIDGSAVVVLPDYFEALNRDFKYQLTVIGELAQAVVEREIEGNRFTIRTDRPNVKVSWQVTGVRRDPYAEAHRIRVEEEKPDTERGRYLHPELYQTTSTELDVRLPIGWIASMFPGQRTHWPGATDALIG
jgi:hypothetical protein